MLAQMFDHFSKAVDTRARSIQGTSRWHRTSGLAAFLVIVLVATEVTGIPAYAQENETPLGTHDAWEGEVGPSRCAAAGWAVDPDDRYTDLNVRILADGSTIASGVADLFRQDLLDAGVSPDGVSAFDIDLWGLVTLNDPHSITAQAQDLQTQEWVDLNLTPKEITCVGTIPDPDDVVNPKMSYFTADCSNKGLVDVTAVFFADDNPAGGSTSAFHVVGENTMFIVYTPGTDKQPDDFCVFGWTGGREPQPPWNKTFEAQVFVAPKGGS